MVITKFGDREYQLPPYMFRELRQAAPYIDAVRAVRERTVGTVEELGQQAGIITQMSDSMHDMLFVIAIGVRRQRLNEGGGQIDNSRPIEAQLAEIVDELEGVATMDQMKGLNGVFNEIMREAGLVAAKTDPTTEAGAPASQQTSNSSGSSLSSSQLAAPEATGTQ